MVPLIAAGIAAAGGLLGQVLGNASRAEAEGIMRRVRDQFGRISPAKVREVAVEVLGPTRLAELERGEEMGAMSDSLGRMGDAVEQGGLTLQDRAALNDALDEVGQLDRAQRANIERQYAGTGSQALLAQLMGQQGSAQRANRAGMNAAGDAQRRYWQLIRDRAGLADSIYGRKAQTIGAQETIDKWNATSRTDAARYNNDLAERAWDRKYRQIAGKAGMATAEAGQKRDDADRTAGMWAGVGQAGAQAADAYNEDRKFRKKYGDY